MRCSFCLLFTGGWRRRCHKKEKVEQRIEDIRIVNRAKCLLIQYTRLTEEEAHRFIEKQAMDRRLTKREIAEEILRQHDIV